MTTLFPFRRTRENAPMTDFADQDDDALARLVQSGELRAFDALARRYQSPLLRFLRRSLSADAEDAVQETFVKAYHRLAQFDPRRGFKNWLFAIAYHESIDQLRRRRVRKSEQLTDAAMGEESGDDPADRAADADRNASLWSIAGRVLSPDQLAAVWLFYVEQMPAREIATVQRRSWVSVKVMLHRARSTLAEHLDHASFSDHAVPAEAGE